MTDQEKMTTPESVEQIVSRVLERSKKAGGLQHVICVACGGSLGGLFPLEYLLRLESKTLRTGSMSSNEFVHACPAFVGEKTLVVLMSKAGTTPETVTAAQLAKEKGAQVMTLSIALDVPLMAPADETIVYSSNTDSYVQMEVPLQLRFGAELLKACENWDHLDDMVQALASVGPISESAISAAKAPAQAFAEKHKDAPVIYTVGSGPLTNIAYTTSICHLMEMEWVHSSSFHSGEFFHGPFEITDKEVPFMLFMSSGRTRPLDERAESFLSRYTDNMEKIDATQYGVDGLAESVREYVEPIVVSAIARIYTTTLAEAKKHPFLHRKYMFKVEY